MTDINEPQFGQAPQTFSPTPERDYQYAATPAGVVSQEDLAAAEARARAAEAAASALDQNRSTVIEAVPEEQRKRFRAFVSPVYPNARFLVKRGPMVSFPDPNSAFGQRDIRRREIDENGNVLEKWAVFSGGVCVTDDPEIIAWCEQRDGFHFDGQGRIIAGICVDANDPRAEAWSNLKKGQLNLAAREPSIEPAMDVGAMVYPEKAAEAGTEKVGSDALLATKEGGVVQSARRTAEALNG